MSKIRDRLVEAYWHVNSLSRLLLGSSIDERRFRSRDPADVRSGFSNLALPHREWFADRILKGLDAGQGKPLDILEVGCGWGPNLAVLARRGQPVRLTGVDISPASISEGRKRLDGLGLSGIALVEMQGSDLSFFADDSADVVFTDAMLLYAGPDKIRRVVREMLRVARRRLVLLEMHDQAASWKGRYTRDGWLRDYGALMKLFVAEDAFRLEKLPAGLRDSGRWPIYGTLVEVDAAGKAKGTPTA